MNVINDMRKYANINEQQIDNVFNTIVEVIITLIDFKKNFY
jgi:hypothetical protein